MNYVTRALILIALVVGASVPALADRDMLYVECRYLVGSDADTAAEVIKIWRLGPVYLRVETQPDPETGEQLVTIVSEKDTWTLNTLTNEATHQRDPSNMADIRVAVFPQAPEAVRALEYGSEKQFFDNRHARVLPDTTLDGTLCEARRTVIDGARLTLYTVKETGVPKQISLKSGDNLLRVVYDVYRPDMVPNLSLFTLPDSVKVVEGDSVKP
jgi:hypothetical protein